MITGSILIGAADLTGAETFEAIDTATGAALGPSFAAAGPDEVARACGLADAAFPLFSETDPETRAAFLEAIAERILAIGEPLIERAMAESGLPRVRLEGERGRTVSQLRLFASVVREGAWVQATIDPALPDRQPPRPDLRRRHVALGPVAVFGASNFPLAFSVAGGDTAAAFAAGCPVVVKGHPAHPGTGELVARAIREAVVACGLHEGVFSYLPGASNALGAALVADPRIKAVGFTGSRGGGLALMRIAADRPEPIPVYAEMSSINPVILLPAAARNRGAALATAYVQSLALGAGQFCTNPGILIGFAGDDLEAFATATGEALAPTQPQRMLTPDIHAGFTQGITALSGHDRVATIGSGSGGGAAGQADAIVLRTDAASFAADPALGHEIFGPSSLVISASDIDEVSRIIESLEGQLTATILMDPEDEPLARTLLPLLARKVGRVLANGWPTGVEVSHAMVHGGPFPATSDSRSTSVGTLAIERFLRPVSYQNIPDALLPEPLRDANPWGITRRIDGVIQPA